MKKNEESGVVSLEQPTHVDRVDTSKITSCPHNMEITRARGKLGVTIFLHPDGQPCTLLNSLQLDGKTLNKEDATLNAEKAKKQDLISRVGEPTIYSRLTTDPELCKQLAIELNVEHDVKKLEDAFLKLGRGKNAVEVFRAIGKALGKTGYKTVLNNVAAVWVKHHEEAGMSHLYPLLVEYLQNRTPAKKKPDSDTN